MLDLEFKFEEPKEFPHWFVDGRTAEIKINDKIIGFIGEVHPRTLKEWKIRMPIVILEISLEEIFEELINKQI